MENFPPDDRLAFSRPSDVAANREARITARQRVALCYSGLWRLIFGLPAAAVALVPAWTLDFWAMVIGVGLFSTGLYLSWRGFSFLGDAVTRNVTYVTGRLTPSFVTSRNGKTYYMTVGPVRTQISHKTYDRLPAGLNCHAYYASGSRHLLSLEPATVDEPHPALRFGSDAAHTWDRLRWRWVVASVALFGMLAGAHTVVAAHPAATYMVSGSISSYVETTGKGAHRSVYLQDSSQEFALESRDHYAPAVPYLLSYVGDTVDLYINSDTNNQVLALRLRETVYATDYYLHPDDQRTTMILSGALIVVLAGAALSGVLWSRYGKLARSLRSP